MDVVHSDRTRLVEAMVEAYKALDLDRTLSYYAESVVVVDAEGAVGGSGKAALRESMAKVFADNPELRADVPVAIAVGDWVCIHSIVDNWAHGDGTRGPMEWIELLQVAGGKITRLQLFS